MKMIRPCGSPRSTIALVRLTISRYARSALWSRTTSSRRRRISRWGSSFVLNHIASNSTRPHRQLQGSWVLGLARRLERALRGRDGRFPAFRSEGQAVGLGVDAHAHDAAAGERAE